MSCQFKLFASIVDVEKLKSHLYAGESVSSEGVEEDDSWNWTVEEPALEDWLNQCCLSLSPSSELLVFSRERNLVILNGKWDSDHSSEGKIKYHISWNGDITQEYQERITAVLCLPLAGQGKLSTHGGADWTAVAVGFSSGAVRFYTENGCLLLSEVLHEEPIKSIKCQSFQPNSSPMAAPQVDELHVAYSSVVCCVQGFALCNSLKVCRNQLARVQGNVSEKIEAPPLVFVKWGLPEQEEISDVSILGSATSSMFNHLTTASLRGGYFATYRSGPPQVATVLASGAAPYLAWHCLLEGSTGPVLTDVAKAVASKLKSAIGSAVPGWLGVSKRTPVEKSKEKASVEPAEAMACRFGLCDIIRKGQRMYMSPQKNLSVVTDTLGRIILVDNTSGIAVRMWKGYRDAECAFIPVEEDKGSGTSRKALYLAIYAPKKAIVEVWALQQGPKIFSVLASKNGRLLYIRHGFMGANNISHKLINSSQHPCVFFTSTGEIKQVCIPFHPILSNKNDPRNRDVYLFKQIKRLLRTSYENSSVELPELCKQMKSDEFKLQVLETAASSKHITPELMESIIEVFLQPVDDGTVEDEPESQVSAKCRLSCERYHQLVTFYTRAVQCLDAPPEYNTVVPSSPADDEEVLSKMLKLSSEEVRRLLVLISFSADNSKVSFKSVENKFSIYISNVINVGSVENTLEFAANASVEDIAVIGEVLCQCVLYGGCSLADWRDFALESGIDPQSLLYASVAYWLKKPLGNHVRSEMSLYVQLLFLITSLVCMKESLAWWDRVRTLIMDSGNSLNALTSTIISRAVYLRTEKQITDEGLLDENDDGWEAISRETCLWSQLLMQVEAVGVLQSALSCKPKLKGEETTVPTLDYINPDISLSSLLLKGPGLVAEYVAKYVTSWGMEPEWFLKSEQKAAELKTDEGQTFQVDSSAEAIPTTAKEDIVFQRLELIKRYFPDSLTPSHIIANMCWEYVSAWAKKPDNHKLLKTGLQCLEIIPDQSLKLGLCSVLWSVHLKTHFENIVKLLQKIGKLPKDRLCEQHANISGPNVKHVLRCLIDFYTIFIESTAFPLSDDEPVSVMKKEAIWTNDCQPSLVDISLAQGDPHVYIIKTQSLCAKALLFLAVFPIRLHRPVTSLLYPIEESMLWMDIRHSETIPAPTPDAKVEETRLTFLLKVVNAATDVFSAPEEMSIEEASHWIGQCYALANAWEVPVDTIRIQQVVNLYRNNSDRFAEEVVGSVNGRAALGTELLILVGQRMKKIIQNSRALSKEGMAHLTPTLSNWINEQKESKEMSDLKDVVQLAALVVSLLPDSSPDHQFASLLLEAIQPLAA